MENESKRRIPQLLSFYPPDKPLPIGTLLRIVGHEEVIDLHWGKCILAELEIQPDLGDEDVAE